MSEPIDDLQAAKNQMLSKQLLDRGVDAPRVLAAMARVPRERFLPDSMRGSAYADNALSIDCGQTISQPYIVGLMTQALELQGDERVLEIGTGSGYQTAVLAELAAEVDTIERHPELSARAEQLLRELGYTNVTFRRGDGTLGWPERAPYDRVIVTAAAAQCPAPLFEQLREGGILVMPIGDADSQSLDRIRKLDGRPHVLRLSGCRFVPLIGARGWPES